MNKTCLLALAAVMVAAPAAFAHTNGGVYGTPKPYCDYTTPDSQVHDYASASPSAVPHPFRILPPYVLSGFVDGNVDDCDMDGVPNDFDGHSEWAVGGAWLLSQDPQATICFGEYAHHPLNPTVWVFDHVWPSGVMFVIGADTIDLVGTGVCGDNVDDVDSGYCFDHCTAKFLPGLDGAYHVYVVNDVLIDPWNLNLQLHSSLLGHVYT